MILKDIYSDAWVPFWEGTYRVWFIYKDNDANMHDGHIVITVMMDNSMNFGYRILFQLYLNGKCVWRRTIHETPTAPSKFNS